MGQGGARMHASPILCMGVCSGLDSSLPGLTLATCNLETVLPLVEGTRGTVSWVRYYAYHPCL